MRGVKDVKGVRGGEALIKQLNNTTASVGVEGVVDGGRVHQPKYSKPMLPPTIDGERGWVWPGRNRARPTRA